ncbi:MAG: regulatory protein RecX [Desulfotomaculaceae bacterium]
MKTEFESARDLSYRLISYRRRTRYELEQRLEKKGFSKEITCQVLTLLVNYGYINDRDYASSWVARRLAKRGFRVIKHELLEKGVEVVIIDETLNEIGQEAEYAAAMKLAVKKAESSGGICSFIGLAGFLERRGFSYDVIGQVCRNISDKAGLA